MLVAVLGKGILYLTFAITIAAALLLLFGLHYRRPRALKVGVLGVRAGAVAATSATGLLLFCLLTDRFELVYVARNSRVLMEWPYKIGALWSGQAGSLLLWLWMLTVYAAIISWRSRSIAPDERRLSLAALAVLSLISAFFSLLVAFIENPFIVRLPAPADGQGMNPLLQNPSMLIHPLLVYGGFVGFSVPFAYAVAALWCRLTGSMWLRMSRGWTLLAWLLLSLGMLVGAEWAYIELGWGGYWGWDPVENASLLPWLSATAFLHSAMVQERRGMLKSWNLGLMLGTYALTILGTLITRSGILDSVHAFAQSPIGTWFIGYLGLVIAISVYLMIDRSDLLKTQPRLQSYLSREVAFHGNNLLFLAVTTAVLWGTMFPIISRFGGTEVTVGPPFYNRVAGPLILALLVLMGLAPLLAWRKSSPEGVGRRLWLPAVAALLCLQVLVLAGVRKAVPLIGFPLVAFTAVLVLGEIFTGIVARRRSSGEPYWRAAWQLFTSNRRRYGGYVVHLGIVCIALGVLASSNFTTEARLPLRLGEVVDIGGFEIRYLGLGNTVEHGVPAVHADLAVHQNGRLVAVLKPEKRYFPGFVETMGPTTEVAVWGSLSRDLYVVLAGFDDAGTVAGFEIYVRPMVAWIWIGGYLLMAGTLFSLWPAPRRRGLSNDEGLWLERLRELDNDLATGKLDPEAFAREREGLLAAVTHHTARERQLVAEIDRLLAERITPERLPQAAGAGGRE